MLLQFAATAADITGALAGATLLTARGFNLRLSN